MEHFIIIQLTDCLSPARPSFHLACLVFIYHLPVSGRIFKAKVVDINYNVRVRPDQTRPDQLTGRERERRRQEKTECCRHFLSLLFVLQSSQSSPVDVIMKHSTNELNNFLYRAGRQRERERQYVTASSILVSPGTADMTDQS